mmetsp:Transcript_20903/g.37662  ORF Transcript_20903/g.37662 Transcript_20903/m.37662 type:complete len:407 (+) Transcript_20903:41-1261(+)
MFNYHFARNVFMASVAMAIIQLVWVETHYLSSFFSSYYTFNISPIKSTKKKSLPIPNFFDENKWVASSPETYPKCHSPISEQDIAYTLVSQGTEGRLSTLRHTCERWKGNISLAVYTNKTEETIIEHLVQDMKCDKEQLTVTCIPPFEELKGKGFPYNYLRRVALDAAVTSHIVYLDMDYVPSSDLEESLYSPAVLKEFTHDNKLALVVAAFEVFGESSNITVPRSRKINGESQVTAYPFKFFDRNGQHLMKKSTRFHAPTNFGRWMTENTNLVYPLECVTKDFEPYIVVQKCKHLPPPQDQFISGHDKVSWIRHLVLSGYAFKSIAGPFCIHLPHARIAGKDFHDYLKRSKTKRAKVQTIKKQFYKHVAAASGKNVSARMHTCGTGKLNSLLNEYIKVATKINEQ